MSANNTNILISGASIAGPTLAYWLKRYGFTPTVIERAPHLREGGYPVDVRNEAVQVAKLMGIWGKINKGKANLGEISFGTKAIRRTTRAKSKAFARAFNLV